MPDRPGTAMPSIPALERPTLAQKLKAIHSLVPAEDAPVPVAPEARAFREEHGDPKGWSTEEWKLYAALGGIE
ncbi:hypothetical protein LKL35_12150 [Streptomyces sp. ET3-23]|uniref:hypothetical protein n=1 Tax=Streptomyces sp. ET3-23 TaxID=2885643 RepID=UPI001D1143E1|nr:hypothetical protein [Streptomyces sp. ET3-23]MCC2276161.1 hypothetical protein [Streptomyces sp. ET3-23]